MSMYPPKINEGGPAFPRDHASDGHNGMSLRAYIATEMMGSLASGHIAHYGHENHWPLEAMAIEAVGAADALIAALEKRP